MTHVATVMAPREALSIGQPEITAFALAISRLGGKPLDHVWLSDNQVFDFYFAIRAKNFLVLEIGDFHYLERF